MKFRTRVVSRLLQTKELGVMIALLALCLLLRSQSDHFATQANLLQVGRQASYYGIMATGMVFVLVIGDVDLSVGSIFTLSNVVMALLLRDKFPLWAALIATLGAGAVCGAINGILSVSLGIPMIIVTLGTLSIYKGIALTACNASPISEFSKDSWFFKVLGDKVLGVQGSIWVMLAVGIAGWITLNLTAFGRNVQAMGGNSSAAFLSGIPVKRYRVLVMTLNGAISALAGITALAFFQSADPSVGSGFELWVIASAIIGGTALSGGSGTVPGAILGALIIALINNGLALLGFSAFAGITATGTVIIIAVALDALVKRRTAARAARLG